MNDKYNWTPEEREEMNYVMEFSPEGRAQLDDKEAMEALVRTAPRLALSMEVMRRLGGECTGWELEEHCDQLIALCGDDATALKALWNGWVALRTN